jgi:hypothetical protein
MNQIQTTAANLQLRLKLEKRPHYLAHPHKWELTDEEAGQLLAEQFSKSLAEVNDYPSMTVAQAFEGLPIHLAERYNKEALDSALAILMDRTLQSVKVPYKIEGNREIAEAIHRCKRWRDFTVEDWRLIAQRIKDGKHKRYNKFELSDLVAYFEEYADEKAAVQEEKNRNATKEKTDDFELGMAEFIGDFRTAEERLADREAGRRPKSYEDWINGKTAISHVERAAMQERDRQRRNG